MPALARTLQSAKGAVATVLLHAAVLGVYFGMAPASRPGAIAEPGEVFLTLPPTGTTLPHRPARAPSTPAPPPATAITASLPEPVAARPSERAVKADDEALQHYAAGLYAHILGRRRPGLPHTGTVILQFSVEENGSLAHLSIVQTSGDAITDAAAQSFLRRAAPFPPPPPGLEPAQRVFTIPVVFG